VYEIDSDSRCDAKDRLNAFQKAQEWGDKIPIGIIYRIQRPTLAEQIPAIADQPLVAQQTNLKVIAELLENFR
jgi:2-oxoglutarate ferredoxin oxidoreductase subunit beta